ncbi:MAG: hypothetical protein AUH11_18850 [Acidobacteria bacterium 13_2_20CM_57_17]|nr:MAG: hypothetical protein AUH11_18850 [Acidobacteria bacterium 13_2_20CM_57_17]
MSSEENHKEMKDLLKQAIPPAQDTELRRDLWPQMLRKLERQPAPALHVPWFDWALAAILCAVLVFFPGSIPALLYHL